MLQHRTDGTCFAGYLKQIEAIGPLKSTRRRWFVLEDDAHFVYYYRTEKDRQPLGRIYLPSAAFSFDPKLPTTFEIRSNGEVYALEAPDEQSCFAWLQALQNQRRQCIEAQIKECGQDSVDSSQLPDLSEFLPGCTPALVERVRKTSNRSDSGSTFYVSEDGQLQQNSLQCPTSSGGGGGLPLLKALLRPDNAGHRPKSPSDETVSKSDGFKISTFTSRRGCKNCSELISVVNSLKERCLDLHDELAASRELIQVLQRSILVNKDQTAALQRLINATESESERLQFYLETEIQRTQLQAENNDYKSKLKEMEEKLKNAEKHLTKRNADVETYRRSVHSKDELIARLADECCQTKITAPVEDLLGDTVEPICEEVLVADVSDQDRLKDLVSGYEKQNQFLNKELLELHDLLHTLESREIKHIRRYYDMEAQYYQLKSRYLLLLNHFQPNKALSPNAIEELVKEAKKTFLSSDTQKNTFTDDLGFYLTTWHAVQSDCKDDLLLFAGELQRKSDQIFLKQKTESDELYLDWLTRWDGFLVNFADKLMVPNTELKELVRSGIPHSYRSRVWKDLVHHWVRETLSDVGSGYFTCLCRQALAKSGERYDPMFKQIDLDLTRTLPHNRYFEDLHAEKVEPLRRVLYAYGQHNPDIGYCQGLNRLAAVALLYLSEEDAFWTLVAIIEHLQPRNYYGRTVLVAQADQRVLEDMLQEKVSKVHAHLRHFEVDLSLFTFNWFLTVFVDNFPHQTYLNIWDCFLLEGNKILFRFALAALKLMEEEILACKSSGALHSFLSKIGERCCDYKKLAQVAFKGLNSFSQKHVDAKRQCYAAKMLVGSLMRRL